MLGCEEYDIEQILLTREDISLTMKGTEQIAYDPLDFQLGYNAAKNEFRVFDDEMANWYVLTCKTTPSDTGQEIKADLSWTTQSSTRTRNDLILTVEKTDSEGHFWMWCEDYAIGIVVKKIE